MSVDHTAIYRWVQKYAPELDKRCRPYLKQTNDSWRVDETTIKVRGKWMYLLYRAVDSVGNTLDFLLNETRSTRAAKRFFRKMPGNSHITQPRVNVEKNPAYIGAVQDLKQDGQLSAECERRPIKYLNTIVGQDHRCVKRQFRAAMGYGTYLTAWRTIRGIEADHMIRKGQIEDVGKSDVISQKQLIHGLFGLAQ